MLFKLVFAILIEQNSAGRIETHGFSERCFSGACMLSVNPDSEIMDTVLVAKRGIDYVVVESDLPRNTPVVGNLESLPLNIYNFGHQSGNIFAQKVNDGG